MKFDVAVTGDILVASEESGDFVENFFVFSFIV